jgi:hypothetical protein
MTGAPKLAKISRRALDTADAARLWTISERMSTVLSAGAAHQTG